MHNCSRAHRIRIDMADSQIERRPVIGMTLMLQHDSTGWQLIGLFPEAGRPPDSPDYRLVRDGGDSKIYQWQGLPLRLQPDQSDDYIYNLTSPGPMLFVICKTGQAGQPVPLRVTADQDECVAAVEFDEVVFQCPMPRPVIAWVREYVEIHWKPGPRRHERKGGDGRQRKRDS